LVLAAVTINENMKGSGFFKKIVIPKYIYQDMFFRRLQTRFPITPWGMTEFETF